MSEKDNGEKAFSLMCKIAIAMIVIIVLVGIIAIIADKSVGRNPDWYVPVKVINGGEE